MRPVFRHPSIFSDKKGENAHRDISISHVLISTFLLSSSNMRRKKCLHKTLMKTRRNLYFAWSILLSLIISTSASSQEEKQKHKLNYGILAQMHFSYAQNDSSENPYGFRLRRLDSRIWSAPTDYFNWSIIVGFDDFFFRILEADVNFIVSDGLKFRIGQFAPPAVRSGAPVDHLFKVPTMTFIERPPITLNWASNSALLAYRTFGVQAHGNFLNNKMYYAFMVGNPKGSSYFYASSKNTIHQNAYNGLAYWGRLEYKPVSDFVLGAFFGSSSNQADTLSNTNDSYGGHILYRKHNISFMAEVVSGSYSINSSTIKYNGGYIECGYLVKHFEPAIRVDYYVPNDKRPDPYNVKSYTNYTLGLNYHASEKIKIQVNYIFKNEQMLTGFNHINNNLCYINLQCFL